VLIRGETGSGKELLARHIHRGSDRSGLFVSVNCGAISPTYADAELFGYAAGSYSGAASSRAGWFGSANGGTLYLDEIGDLPLPIQVKLLAALENRSHPRRRPSAQPGGRAPGGRHQHRPGPGGGGRQVSRAPVSLPQRRPAGLPALRERVGDILSLAEYFLGIYSQRLDLPVPLISEAAQHLLERHSWPGNTRELENVIHFALLVSTGDEILPEHLNLPRRWCRSKARSNILEKHRCRSAARSYCASVGAAAGCDLDLAFAL
jgi:transcriptional regulator with AAA-type ATPase domain